MPVRLSPQLRYVYLSLFLCLPALAGCGGIQIRVAEGDRELTQRVKDVWVPRLERALLAFDKRVRDAGGKPPGAPPPYEFTTSEEQFDELVERFEEKPDMALPAYSPYPSNIYRHAIASAIEWRSKSYLNELLGSAAQKRLPPWMASGLPQYLGNGVIDDFADPDVRSTDELSDILSRMRRDKIGKLSMFSALDLGAGGSPADRSEFNVLSAYAVGQLAERMGPGFDRAWIALLSRMRDGQSFETAFEAAYGLSFPTFRLDLGERLDALLSTPAKHAGSLPELAGPATLDDESKLPFRFSRFVDGFAKYLSEGNPKAFAYSRRGAWVYFSDSPDAVERALRDCRSVAPLGCKLLAVDDQFVAPGQTGPSRIDVEFIPGDSDWSRQVRERWLPVVNLAISEFVTTLESKWQVQLPDPSRVYVVTTRDDYERILRDRFGSSSIAARIAAEGTDGLASIDGQVIAGLYATTPTQELWETATLLTLHELVHEMQNQLAGSGGGGRRLQRWIKEGSAEQISYLIARGMPVDPSAKFAVSDWRSLCVEWYKLSGVRETKPADVLDAGFEDWMKLSRSGKQPYKMAGLMLEFLQERLGKDYYPALLKYFRDGAGSAEAEEQAFETFAGMTRSDFVKAVGRWLDTL